MKPDEHSQLITLVANWRGGEGMDVVSLSHNGRLVPFDEREVQLARSSATIAYEVSRAPRHRVRAVFSFIGDTRTDLTLYCMIDGVLAGGPIQAPRADHRWEIGGGWTPFSG